jgi:hypothetical protein
VIEEVDDHINEKGVGSLIINSNQTKTVLIVYLHINGWIEYQLINFFLHFFLIYSLINLFTHIFNRINY